MKLFKHPKHKSFNFVEAASTFTELLPEIAFFGGSTESTLDSYDQITVPDSIQNTIGITWNGIDAGCSLIAALLLLLDKKDPYQTEKNAKVATLIISTLQGTILSALNFGSPALVISLGIDLCMAVQALYKEAKKVTLAGWFEDALIEISYIRKRLEEETLDEEVRKNLKDRLNLLKSDIAARINAQCYNTNKSEASRKKACIIIDKVFNTFKNDKYIGIELPQFYRLLGKKNSDDKICFAPDYLSRNRITSAQIDRDKAIQEQANQDRTNQALLVFFKAATLAAVVGITITAPALVTLIVVSLTAATYIFNHGKQLYNKHQQSKGKGAEGSPEETQSLFAPKESTRYEFAAGYAR